MHRDHKEISHFINLLNSIHCRIYRHISLNESGTPILGIFMNIPKIDKIVHLEHLSSHVEKTMIFLLDISQSVGIQEEMRGILFNSEFFRTL